MDENETRPETNRGRPKGPRGEAHLLKDPRWHTWRLRFHVKGKVYRSGTLRHEHQARQLITVVNGVLLQLRMGLVTVPDGAAVKEFVLSGGKIQAPPPVQQQARPSITELLDRYQEYAKPPTKQASTYATELHHLEHFRRFLAAQKLGKKAAAEITFENFEDYKRLRAKKVALVTVNKELVTLRSAFTFGATGGLVPKDSLDRIKRFKKAKKPLQPFMTGTVIEEKIARGAYSEKEKVALRRSRILTETELAELISLVGPSTCAVPVAIARHTGARRGEIARVTWADIDLDGPNPTMRFKSKKQSQTTQDVPRDVQIAPPLLSILKQHRDLTGGKGYLFGLNTDVSGALTRATPWRPHGPWRPWRTPAAESVPACEARRTRRSG